MRLFLAVTAAALAGCAAMDGSQCASGNWYDTGFRDGIFGVQSQDNIYATQCGQRLDVARYAEGYRDGRAEFHRRKATGGSD